MSDIGHERELRDEWQEAHENVHTLEKEAREAAAKGVEIAMNHLNNVRQEAAADRLQFSQQIGHCLSKDDFRREHEQLVHKLEGLQSRADNLDGRIWVIPAIMSLLTLFLGFMGVYLMLKAHG